LTTYGQYFWIEDELSVAFRNLVFAGEHFSDTWYGFMQRPALVRATALPETGTRGRASRATMAALAGAFVETLSEPQRRQASWPFDDSERFNWHYVPRERAGLPIEKMSAASKTALHDLLRYALSETGYQKAVAVMSLEEPLGLIENHERFYRHPENYSVTVFGTPGRLPWGWRIEGHHLSLNFSSVSGQVVSVTPAFFGSNPAELRDGPRAGLRVLGAEEDLGRQLITGCSPDERKEAIIAVDAPGDVIALPGLEINFAEPEGLSAAEMSADQQRLFRQLLDEVIGNFNRELKDQAWREIDEAGFDKLHFAWAGSLKRGEGHYFRIHGPTLVIEYDNTQNEANHAHLVWHSPGNNFGADYLRRHYSESPHHHPHD
jgi:hypothetical protein